MKRRSWVESTPPWATCLGIKDPIYPMCGRGSESTCLEDIVRCSKRLGYLSYKIIIKKIVMFTSNLSRNAFCIFSYSLERKKMEQKKRMHSLEGYQTHTKAAFGNSPENAFSLLSLPRFQNRWKWRLVTSHSLPGFHSQNRFGSGILGGEKSSFFNSHSRFSVFFFFFLTHSIISVS